MVDWNKCLSLIPKGTATYNKSFTYLGGINPFLVKKGKGSYLYTDDGRKLLDFGCALGPNILGYDNKKVKKAIKKQLKKGTLFSLPTSLEYEVAEKITQIIPNAEMVHFSKNGTDAVLASIRIASEFTGKYHVARFGYNGFSDRVACSFMPGGIPEFNKELIHDFKYNDLNSLEDILKNYKCCCVLMEPVSLEEPKNNFLQEIKNLTKKYNCLLIFDEVVSGFRFNYQGCQKLYNVDADLICLGKAISNGMPLSVVCGKKDYMKLIGPKVFYAMTFGGETLSLASAKATINELGKKDYSHIWQLGILLKKGMLSAADKNNIKIEYIGAAPRHRFEILKTDYNDADGIKALFNQEMIRCGIFFPRIIYINFSHTIEDIQYVIECADKSFAFIKKYIDNNNIDEVLEAPRAIPIFG